MFDDALFQLLELEDFQNVFCRNCPKHRERLKWIDARRKEEIAALEFFAGIRSEVSDEPSDDITICLPPEPPCIPADVPDMCLRWKAIVELCEKAKDFEKQCWRVAEDTK